MTPGIFGRGLLFVGVLFLVIFFAARGARPHDSIEQIPR
jgi:hypothetical protein